MTTLRYDVLGIGNAIVDVIARAEDDFLVAQGMHKGTMALIDEARAEQIYAAMGPAVKARAARLQIPLSASPASARARPSSARSMTTSSAAPLPTTSAPPASPMIRRRRRKDRRLRVATSW
jgi:hypothetical protein